MTERLTCGLCGAVEHVNSWRAEIQADDTCQVCDLVTCATCWNKRREEHGGTGLATDTCGAKECTRATWAAEELLYG